MGSKKDVQIGSQFGLWTVLDIEVKNPNSKAKRVRNGALCQCECGTLRYIEYRSLYDGRTTNCGCIGRKNTIQKRMALGNTQPGEKYGHLTVLEDVGMMDNQHKSKCQCDCGNIIYVANDHLKTGHTQSCGCIKISRGVQKIKNVLQQANIPFIQEYTFQDLKSPLGKNLRFDFAIFKNSQLYRLIEFDGAQHFEPQSGYYAGKFEQIQLYDKIKNDYCNEHNIPLVRISYLQENEIDLSLLKLESYWS